MVIHRRSFFILLKKNKKKYKKTFDMMCGKWTLALNSALRNEQTERNVNVNVNITLTS